jgi:hypothetical protein
MMSEGRYPTCVPGWAIIRTIQVHDLLNRFATCSNIGRLVTSILKQDGPKQDEELRPHREMGWRWEVRLSALILKLTGDEASYCEW